MKNLLYFILFQNIFVKMSCEVVKLVIDTDMDFDVDDVGALCAAHALETLGEAQIMAIVTMLDIPKQLEQFQSSTITMEGITLLLEHLKENSGKTLQVHTLMI